MALSRPLDLLGVYQHAWVSQAKLQNVTADSATQKLLQARHRIWDAVRFWARAVPQRNVLVMLGDFNCSLRTCLPHIGSGLAPHKHLQHPDQHEFQALVQHCGLVALNTFGHAGRPSGTYLHFNSHVVQIDFILTRLPCHQSAKQARPIPHAEVVHPTGLRHVPVATYLSVAPPKPCPPKPQPVNRTLVQKLFQQHPGAEACYQQRVQQLLTADRDPEQALQAAWIECTSRFHVSQSRARQVPEYSLKNFWASKTRLREALREVDLYWSPVAWHCSDSCTTTLAAHFPGALSRLSVILQGWKAAIEFAKQNRHLRQRVLQTKRHEVDSLIRDAQATRIHGLSGLYRLSRKLHPKTPRRSIHFRFPDGRLMTEAEELRSLQAYFEDLYDSHSIPHQHWVLHEALQITRQEVELAFQHFSATKALPLSQIPACLWKVCSGPLIPHVQALFNAALQPGPLVFPVHWHKAFLTLLPKPGKQPNQPGNLRPISLLPALPKLLARIAAERLKPYLIATLQRIPQYAYTPHRQAADAVDRVLSHCWEVRELIKGNSRNVFKLHEGRSEIPFCGGLQLSLDLSKAYDRLPRTCLYKALQRVGAPEDLISLIMYMHSRAELVLQRHEREASARMGRGVRQGCGLSPLLWLSFTVLIFDKLNSYLPDNALTGYADDFHAQWKFKHPREFSQAVSQIRCIIHDLRDLGMQPALDKTVVWLGHSRQGSS